MTSPTPSTPFPSRSVEPVAEALHHAMCDVSHHDRDVRCSRWSKYPNIAASVVPALSRSGHILVKREAWDRLRDAAEDALQLLSSAYVEAGPDEPDATIVALRAALTQP